MKSKKEVYVFVGPDPLNAKDKSPGGQLAAAIGLRDYAEMRSYHFKIIDTLQENFPIPPFLNRLKRGCLRILVMIKILTTCKVKGIIIFSGSGFSLYERIFMALICRLFFVRSFFFIRSGFFLNNIKNSHLYSKLSSKLLQVPHFVGVQGEVTRLLYESIGVNKQKIVLVRNWLSNNIIENIQPKKVNTNQPLKFCFTGWLVKEKGIIELLEAIVILSKKYKFEFVFIGGGVLEPYLLDSIQFNKLSTTVFVTGWLDRIEVVEQLKNCHVFVLPTKAEGFPNALLEAMAYGLPAVCTDVGAISDSLVDGLNGFLLQDGNEQTIARALENYLVQPSLVESQSIEALKVISKYHNLENNCEILFNTFNK